jgi:hypothetical protein
MMPSIAEESAPGSGYSALHQQKRPSFVANPLESTFRVEQVLGLDAEF